MKGTRHTREQVITKLRHAEKLKSEGASATEIARALEVTEQTYYRWRNRYGDMGRDEVKYLRELEKENERLKKLVADLSLDKQILNEVLKGKY
jgi:transposase-like protein